MSTALMFVSLIGSKWNLSKKISLVLTVVVTICAIMIGETFSLIQYQQLIPLQKNNIWLLLFAMSLWYHLVLMTVSISHQLSLERQKKALQKDYKGK